MSSVVKGLFHFKKRDTEVCRSRPKAEFDVCPDSYLGSAEKVV